MNPSRSRTPFARRLGRLLPLLLSAALGLSWAQPAPPPTEAPQSTPDAPSTGPGALDPQTGLPAAWPDPTALEFDPVSFSQPELRREALPNGLVVYLLEDPSLPLIDGAAFVKTGSLYDPEDKVSLAAMTANLMRTGGAGARTADELDGHLERLAASVEVVASDVFTTASFSSLTEAFDEVLPAFVDVLTEPTFAPERLELARGGVLEALRRENDDPVNIALREFFKRVSQGHPAGYAPTEATVNAVTRDDLVAFHARYFKPNETVLALSGDFDADEMLAALRTAFADWEPGEVDYPELPPYDETPPAQVLFAQRDLGQSIILLGHPAVYAYTPAYNALDVANAVLGSGGFSSRIFTEVRTKRGLAYSAGSSLRQGFLYPGTFFAYSFTRTDRTGEALGLLKAELTRLTQEPVGEAELEVQRDNILNGAVFRFTSPAAIVQRTARAVEVLGLPADYYDRYIERVQTITPEEVLAAAREHLRPDELIVMVVGNAAEFDRPLSEFGEVETIRLE